MILRFFILFFSGIFLFGCSLNNTVYAPVQDVTTIETIPKSGVYRVHQGDTLYSIAWAFGLDYRYLAQRNNIDKPYSINTGRLLYLRGKALGPGIKSAVPEKPSSPLKIVKIEKEPNAAVTYWKWPAKGALVGTYSELNRGINISGKIGDAVYATAPGKIVYSGNGLRGYGNLIIIKHNSLFLTAYAHNYLVFVKEGDWVQRGQKIAEMGPIGRSKQVALHFEIRRSGQPVNPLNYLNKRS